MSRKRSFSNGLKSTHFPLILDREIGGALAGSSLQQGESGCLEGRSDMAHTTSILYSGAPHKSPPMPRSISCAYKAPPRGAAGSQLSSLAPTGPPPMQQSSEAPLPTVPHPPPRAREAPALPSLLPSSSLIQAASPTLSHFLLVSFLLPIWEDPPAFPLPFSSQASTRPSCLVCPPSPPPLHQSASQSLLSSSPLAPPPTPSLGW